MHQTTISTQTYQGWSNRETWLGSLWLGNDEGLYELLCHAVRENNTISETAMYIEEELRQQLEDEIDVACLWQDLLGWAFDQINWIEIVASNFEELKEF